MKNDPFYPFPIRLRIEKEERAGQNGPEYPIPHYSPEIKNGKIKKWSILPR